MDQLSKLIKMSTQSADKRNSHTENGERHYHPVKIPASIRFSDVLRSKTFSSVFKDLERTRGHIYRNYYSQNKAVLCEYLHQKFEFWKENYPHDVAFLWLMQGYYHTLLIA